MSINSVQFQAGLSMAEFIARYGTEAKCYRALYQWRWPQGFRCPACTGRARSRFRRGTTVYYQCRACRHQTTLTAGTMFEGTKLPLRTWLLALHLLTATKTNLAALELLREVPDLDAVVVPLGGGGLAAGTALAVRALAPGCELFLAEPEGAADGARSFARGALDHDGVPETVCDGLRGTLGAPNFALLRASGARVLTVDDARTVAAMRLLWTRSKQLVEPSSAIALAAVLAHPALFAGRRVGVILSGGNVDLDALPALFALAGDTV